MSAIVVNKEITYSAPPKIITTWEITDYLDSTGITEIVIPGLIADEDSYRRCPNKLLTGAAYAIQLLTFSISCSSTDFNVRLLNRNDITQLDTIFEVYSYSNINLSHLDQNFEEFVIRNRDTTLTNKLYLYTENASGTITLTLTYINLQDRSF